MDQITRHSGRWTFEDRFASPWHYLPVEVPPGSREIRVELDYDRTAATLDLGCLGPAGFRGWSGGARRSFVISADVATPGYLPGELDPGTWHVIIGIYRLRPEGVPYQVTATVAELGRRPGLRICGRPRRPRRRHARPGASCPRPPAGAGSPATCTRTRSIPMAR